MTQYAVLVYMPAPAEPDPAAMGPDFMALMEQHEKVISESGSRMVSGFALHGGATATTVRGDVVTDGPFAEAKEIVAGFYILEAPDLDAALRVAKADPATRVGAVEVRPIFDSQ